MNIHRCRFVDYTPNTISAIAFSHTSNKAQVASSDLRLAVGRNNGDIEIWNPKYNWTHEISLFGSRGRSIEGLCWAVNDDYGVSRLFSIGGSTYITEWDLQTGLPKVNYDCNIGVIWSLAVNKQGTRLAVGSDDGSVAIVDISGGIGSLEHEMICQRQELRILSIKWYENDIIVGGCADARIRCWSASKETKGRIMGTMRVDKSKTESTLVWSVNVLSKRKQIVSGDSTGSVKVWDLNTFTLLQSFNNHEADVLSITNDASEERIFTAGVDRKIHQFNLVSLNSTTKSKNSKWAHSYNRLLHSNDIRSMAVFESKGYNFLISGGVETSIVIQSINQFHDGKYRKLTFSQQQKNMLFNENKKYIVMWKNQQIKIWRVLGSSFEDSDNATHKLVSKLNLSDDDNITDVSLNKEGTLLAVGTMTSVKVFTLTPTDKNKLSVSKFRDDNFDSLVGGSKRVLIYDQNKLLVFTQNEELYKFSVDIDEQTIELVNEVEFEGDDDIKSNLGYVNNVKTMSLNEKEDTLILSKFNGVIEVVLLKDLSSYVLVTLPSAAHITHFSSDHTLVILTEDNKIYEFQVQKSSHKKFDSLLTPWSTRNSEFLPKQFLTLEEKAEGMFAQGSKIWIYGSNWLCSFDLSVNIPINKFYKNTGLSKKRNRDGLTIDEDEDDEDDDNLNSMEQSLRQSEIDKLQGGQDNSDDSEKPFWISLKYRPILYVDNFDEKDLVLIESPSSIPSTPAYQLPKIKV